MQQVTLQLERSRRGGSPVLRKRLRYTGVAARLEQHIEANTKFVAYPDLVAIAARALVRRHDARTPEVLEQALASTFQLPPFVQMADGRKAVTVGETIDLLVLGQFRIGWADSAVLEAFASGQRVW